MSEFVFYQGLLNAEGVEGFKTMPKFHTEIAGNQNVNTVTGQTGMLAMVGELTGPWVC